MVMDVASMRVPQSGLRPPSLPGLRMVTNKDDCETIDSCSLGDGETTVGILGGIVATAGVHKSQCAGSVSTSDASSGKPICLQDLLYQLHFLHVPSNFAGHVHVSLNTFSFSWSPLSLRKISCLEPFISRCMKLSAMHVLSKVSSVLVLHVFPPLSRSHQVTRTVMHLDFLSRSKFDARTASMLVAVEASSAVLFSAECRNTKPSCTELSWCFV